MRKKMGIGRRKRGGQLYSKRGRPPTVSGPRPADDQRSPTGYSTRPLCCQVFLFFYIFWTYEELPGILREWCTTPLFFEAVHHPYTWKC
jgi:hypothetical protein